MPPAFFGETGMDGNYIVPLAYFSAGIGFFLARKSGEKRFSVFLMDFFFWPVSAIDN